MCTDSADAHSSQGMDRNGKRRVLLYLEAAWTVYVQIHLTFAMLEKSPLTGSRLVVLVAESQFIRTEAAFESTRGSRFDEAREAGQLSRVFEGVNYIAGTPWVINKKVLRIIEAVQLEQAADDARDKLKKAEVDPLMKYEVKKLSEKEDPDRLVSLLISFRSLCYRMCSVEFSLTVRLSL
jgi:hypothetical protein